MTFGSVQVLRDINVAVAPGEIHAVCGENGAGKSTLMKILSGIYQPSAGEVFFEGKPAHFHSATAAEAAGIMMIHQEFTLASSLTVQQNFFLGRELRTGPFFRDREMDAKTREALALVGCTVAPNRRISDLSVSECQLVEIAKMLARNASVLILDEPTAVLTRREVRLLLERIRELSDRGVSILYVSHKLDEILAIAHRVTILRDGRHVLTENAAALNQARIVRHMVGREIDELFRPKENTANSVQPALEVENFRVEKFIDDASFSLKRGEILGFAGLIGSGRTELWEGILGLRPGHGTIRRNGRTMRFRNYTDALFNGHVGYLSEDRKGKGILLDFKLRPNATLAALRGICGFVLSSQKEETAWRAMIKTYDIHAASFDVPARLLSGGNQQKLALGKLLATNPEVVVLDEPTRGIDTGAKQQIYALIHQLAETGKAVVVISSELPEIIGLCHRVAVLANKRIAAIVEGPDINEETIMRHATNVAPQGVGLAA
ncbi:MAG TPA: sugar ABC transporter ATP-binding protein [Chthoniobacterales bacterium]